MRALWAVVDPVVLSDPSQNLLRTYSEPYQNLIRTFPEIVLPLTSSTCPPLFLRPSLSPVLCLCLVATCLC